ncbi:helix-turn-helix transcriptional regulator [Rhodoferax sp. 4810]|nr:helix-turn-helix transcriptional regulator [Rhodoferax jenense]
MTKDEQRKKMIGVCIQRKRLEAGYTQEIVSEKLNLALASYARYETGNATPNILMLIRIAEIFECGLDELLVGISTKPDDQAKYITNLLQDVERADRLHIVKIVERICLISKGKSKI